jgi:hypothetical protein
LTSRIASNAAADLIQNLGDVPIPIAEQTDRRKQCGPVRGNVGQFGFELSDRVRFVEAENLLRGIGTVAEAIPDLALFVLVTAKQDMAIAVRTGDQGDDRFRLGKSRQIVKVAVISKRKERVAIARNFRRRRHERNTAAGVFAHLLQQRIATLAVDVVGVIHGSIRRRTLIICRGCYQDLR